MALEMCLCQKHKVVLDGKFCLLSHTVSFTAGYVYVCVCAARTQTEQTHSEDSPFQNRRKGKEKQAKREVRRVPVRKDERRGARNLSPEVIFKPRTGTLLLTSPNSEA